MDLWRVGDWALAWIQVVLLFTTTFKYSIWFFFQLPYTCIGFFFYKSHILVKAVFFATAIYLHRFCFSPVKLGLGQQRKKPEATAGLDSEMVLGATTWLVSSQRDLCRGHVFFRFGGTLAF